LKHFEATGLVRKTRRYNKSTIYELVISAEINTSDSSVENNTASSEETLTASSVETDTLITKEPLKEPSSASKESSWVFRWSEFWTKYPSSKNKKKSEVAFKNLSAKDQKAAIAALSWYEFSSDKKYIPMASTWINGRRWEDEDGEAEQTIREVEW
jgi:hypothetical protein